MGGEERCMGGFGGETGEGHYMEDLGRDGRIY
jgi:hypothetical protein